MYVYIVNRRFKKLFDFENNIDFIFDLAYKNRDTYNILWNVDPYWVTYFNKIQIVFSLVYELKKMIKFIPEKKHELSIFIEFIKKVEQHNFLVIVWD